MKENIIKQDIKFGRQTLDLEIEGLKALRDALDIKFSKAVGLILTTKGRVITSGMGKSGHVAKKIAATLASTGTPSFFVHPGEASHGDLGMVTKDDVLMLLSNSGETAELRDVITYAKRFSIPLIGIVRRKTSALVEASDISLILPEISEASPVSAPTTSTTMMMALGDAIAVSLMIRRGFKPDDFKLYHPGGKIGQSLTKVSELMRTKNLPLVSYENSLDKTIDAISKSGLGIAAVHDKSKRIIGVITDGDLRRLMKSGRKINALKASDVMSKNPHHIKENSMAAEAIAIMNDKKVTALIVKNSEGKLAGIIHIHDLLKAGIS